MSCNKFTTGFGVNKVVVHGWLPTADDGWSKDARLCQRHMCDSRLCLCPAKKHLQRPLLLPEIKEKTHHYISCIRYSSSVQVSRSIETFLFCHYLASKSADSEPCSGILIESRHRVFLFGNDQPTNTLTRELKKAVSKYVHPCTSSYILSAKSLWSLNQTLRHPHVQMLGHAMFHASSWVSSKGSATLPHLWLSKRLPSCLWHLHRRSLCTTVSCVQHDQFARLASTCPSCGLLSLFWQKEAFLCLFHVCHRVLADWVGVDVLEGIQMCPCVFNIALRIWNSYVHHEIHVSLLSYRPLLWTLWTNECRSTFRPKTHSNISTFLKIIQETSVNFNNSEGSSEFPNHSANCSTTCFAQLQTHDFEGSKSMENEARPTASFEPKQLSAFDKIHNCFNITYL